MAMLGDIVELSVVVHDLEAAAARFSTLFGLRVHQRETHEGFGFKNAILPTGIGHIELMQPTDPAKAVGRFLAKRGEGVYLVGFECGDVPVRWRRCAATACRSITRARTSPGCTRATRMASSSSCVIARITTDERGPDMAPNTGLTGRRGLCGDRGRRASRRRCS